MSIHSIASLIIKAETVFIWFPFVLLPLKNSVPLPNVLPQTGIIEGMESVKSYIISQIMTTVFAFRGTMSKLL